MLMEGNSEFFISMSTRIEALRTPHKNAAPELHFNHSENLPWSGHIVLYRRASAVGAR